MTAIGFILIVLGFLLYNIWGDDLACLGRMNWANYTGIAMFLLGVILGVIGIGIKLWEIMP